MRYLVIHVFTESEKPVAFRTEWFEPENNFNPEAGMIVFDLAKNLFTIDGKTWNEITEDHL